MAMLCETVVKEGHRKPVEELTRDDILCRICYCAHGILFVFFQIVFHCFLFSVSFCFLDISLSVVKIGFLLPKFYRPKIAVFPLRKF